ncbi:hypothetical protein [Mesorhizobium sp. B1-1-7]|uniref:hypothetical protein n=1 Tax=Mesorhizobium sp. B1-1-7 TaxID=2589977 RepID=UPI001129C0F5|nr:hypothetical protein [Mesorhizobium sp. B1-1-7]TPN43240.1 hypothetical protein FJ978_31560 [Mesorhizobium sp. B1-1-7]
MAEDIFTGDDIEIIVTRKPKISIDWSRPYGDDDPLADLHDQRQPCTICGASIWLMGHHNLVVDYEARTARFDGTQAINCYGCRGNMPGLYTYGPYTNVSERDWRQLSLANALVRAIRSEARHG